ncbi:Uncharacterised protein [Mycobacteroides abscessus subsp. abscessus]|nr:Uncharacterised protein [Mycobacteroides abscessus subsp. abscessus]
MARRQTDTGDRVDIAKGATAVSLDNRHARESDNLGSGFGSWIGDRKRR